jgi:hypothetical protein
MCCSYYLFKKLYMGRIIMQVSLIMLRVKLASWEWCDGRHLFECIFDMAPGRLQEGSRRLQECSRKAPGRLQEGPRKAPGRLQEGSMKAPGRLQIGSRKAPGKLQEGSRKVQEGARKARDTTRHTHPKELATRVPKSPRRARRKGRKTRIPYYSRGSLP